MAVWFGGLIILVTIVILAFGSPLGFPGFNFCPSIQFERPCEFIFNNRSSNPPENGCANPNFRVICENNKPVIYINYEQYYTNAVIASNSSSSLFTYITTGVSPDNNCPIINSVSLSYENVSFFTYPHSRGYMMVMRCEKPVNHYDYVDISSETCGGGIVGQEYQYSYLYASEDDNDVMAIAESCRIDMKAMIRGWDGDVKCDRKCGYTEIHTEYVNGIELRWPPKSCEQLQKQQHRDSSREGGRFRLLCTLNDVVSICHVVAQLCK